MTPARRREPASGDPERLRLASPPSLAPAIPPLLSIEDLCTTLNCSRPTIERMRSAGKLPKADVYVGRRLPRWRVETIRRWIEGGSKA
jgi:excisionase family DNA binding protein